jgi:hypothetical protein
MEMSDFDHDVFISYAHIDNDPLSEEQKGWITMFHDALLKRLAQLLGKNPNIWRDKKLSGNDRFDNEIIDQLVRAATLIAVLSPRYVQSEWCIREFEKFREVAQTNVGLDVGNKSRLFKVVKTPIDREKEPEIARGLLGYSFYKQDPETGRWREFNRAFGKDLEPEFWCVLDDLAQDLAKLLGLLDVDQPPGVPDSGFTVYLAETTSGYR